MGRLPHFLSYGAPPTRFAPRVELRYKFQIPNSMILNAMFGDTNLTITKTTTLFLLYTTNGWPVKFFKSFNESVLRESI